MDTAEQPTPAMQTGEILSEEFQWIHKTLSVWTDVPSAKNGYLFGKTRPVQKDRDKAQEDWDNLKQVERQARINGWNKIRLDDYYRNVHALKQTEKDPGQTALCLSGGGVRSAAFALGVMQGLASKKLLSQFHYLSTVSGGGYIGGWLTAWASRAAQALPDPAAPGGGKSRTFIAIENQLGSSEPPSPLRELRKNSAFLTPRVGPGSPDAWAVAATYLRNVILNWLVYLPLIALVLLAPRFVEALLMWWTSFGSPNTIVVSLFMSLQALSLRPLLNEISLDPHTWLDGVGVIFVGGGMLAASLNSSRTNEDAIDDKGFFRWVLMPVIIGALLLVAQSSSWMKDSPRPSEEMFWQWVIGGGLLFAVVRLIAYVLVNFIEAAQCDQDLNEGVIFVSEDLAAQFVSGCLSGFVVWLGLYLRNRYYGSDPYVVQYDATFGVPWYLMAFLAGNVLLSGLTSYLFPLSGDRNREWWARAIGWYSVAALVWAAVSAIVILGLPSIHNVEAWLAGLTGGSGILSLAGGGPLGARVSQALKRGQASIARIVAVASFVFIACLFAWIAKVTSYLLLVVSGYFHHSVSLAECCTGAAGDRLIWILITAVFLAAFIRGASFFINVNYFSLNSMYRNRIIRSFLGPSNTREIIGRDPPARNPFDGFSESDNIPMHKLRCDASPFHLLNMTLNLTATKNTAWQERKAASFIATQLYCGGDLVGYRPAESYGNGITLGWAMAISGAAAGPNWGYHSSVLTSFIMAIFNIRLGAWTGNPRDVVAEKRSQKAKLLNKERWKKDGPDTGWQLFEQEILGHSSDDGDFVYLSDGGHFENLGLYEMVRRRCHTIVVSDASQDPDCALEDLGNAIRKIYIDLGVRIEFESIDVRKREADVVNSGVYCAVGRVIYPEDGAKQGIIVYIKPGYYLDAPADVRAYGATNAKFPHDSTMNQWFMESQFESYRALGEHAIEMIAAPRDASGAILKSSFTKVEDLRDFCTAAEAYVKGHKLSVKR